MRKNNAAQAYSRKNFNINNNFYDYLIKWK